MTRSGTGFRTLAAVIAVLCLALVGGGQAIALDEVPGAATPGAESSATEPGAADTSGDADLGGNGSGGGEAPDGGAGADTTETGSPPADPGAGNGTTDGAIGATSNQSSGETGEATGGGNETGGGNQTTGNGTTDPGTGGGPASTPTGTDDVGPAQEEGDTVQVIVQVYNCDEDPGDVGPGDPPAGCAVAPSISVLPTVDSTPLDPVVTNPAGQAFIDVPPGADLTVVEDPLSIPVGYEAREGDAGVTISPVEEGAIAFLVNVLLPEEDEEELGRIQLVKGTCPTTGDSRTKLTVIGPNTFMAQAESVEGCYPVAGAEFLITGGDLPEEGLLVTTEANGSWRGELPPGPYTVTEVASGESAEIEVPDFSLVVVIAIEYVAPETGTLAVRRYVCVDSEAEAEVTTIETFLNPPAAPDPGPNCFAEDGSFQLNDGEPFDGGGDGAISFKVPVGTYQFTDLTSAQTATVDIELDATTYVLVRRIIQGSELTVQYFFCESEDAYLGSASDAAYWSETCPGATAGIELRLIDAAGNVVGTALTNDNGLARWSNLLPGEYRIRGLGDRATCAVFVGGTPSLGGFVVSSDTVYVGTVYGCVKPASDDGTGGDGDGTEGDGTGNGTNGDGTGGENNVGNTPPPSAGGSAKVGDSTGGGGTTVTALPNTGAAGEPERSSPIWPLVAAVLLAGGMGVEVVRRKRAA